MVLFAIKKNFWLDQFFFLPTCIATYDREKDSCTRQLSCTLLNLLFRHSCRAKVTLKKNLVLLGLKIFPKEKEGHITIFVIKLQICTLDLLGVLDVLGVLHLFK